ncbi:MAG: hypothetical protein D6776_03640 [Planctomycetota bacterium]|nr:MAG: hypothetical protein D6776_03640 [Planctomycetota bacterium]
MDPQTADRLIRMAAAMAWLDGAPQVQEKRLLQRLAERLGTSPEVRRKLAQWLEERPPEVELDLRSLDRATRRQFLRIALAVADADTHRHPDELRGLRWLARMVEAAEREEEQRQLSCSRLPSELEETERLTDAARERIEAADATADELERAIHRVERACSDPYAHRAAWWADVLDAALHALRTAVADHVRGLLEQGGLYDELEKAQPGWRARRDALEAHWEEIERGLEKVHQRLEAVRGGNEDEARIVREQLARLLSLLRDALTEEKDVVYTAFYRHAPAATASSPTSS